MSKSANNTGSAAPKPKERQRRVRIGKLTSVGRVAIELGRLYRQARYGEVETIEAYRLASVLSVMAKCLETSEFERRLAAMETAVAQRETVEHFRPKVAA
jgi:hypothetical protein